MKEKSGILIGSLIFVTASVLQAQISPLATGSNTNFDNLVVAPTLRQPAVSGVNGKVDYAGGIMKSAEGHNASASISLPVWHPFGFQADGLYSRIGGLDFYGGAGHLFWRDPDHGLLGLAGGYLYRDGADTVDTFQVGAEGELYWRQFVFGFFGGVGSIGYRYTAPFIDTNPTRFVGRVSTDYYPLEDLRVGASFTSAFRDYLGKGEAEYQLPIPGLALTAEAAWGNNGYYHWLLGVRYYFGGRKTLHERHRQDDPPSLMPQVIQSLGLYGAEFNRKLDSYLATETRSGNTDGSNSGTTSNSGNATGGGSYGFVLGELVNP